MNITTTERDGMTVIALSGDIDLSRSPALRKVLLELMFTPRDIAVDLSAVHYIDSSGLAALVEAYQSARHAGSRFVLDSPSEPVLRVLRLARLDRVFTIVVSGGGAPRPDGGGPA